MALPFFISQNRCVVLSLTAERLWTSGLKCFKLAPKQPTSPESRFLGLHVSVVGTYMKVNLTQCRVTSQQTLDKPMNKSLFLEFCGFVTVTGVVGRWLRGLTLSLYPHFLILRSFLSIQRDFR